jgi:hypothetical protein
LATPACETALIVGDKFQSYKTAISPKPRYGKKRTSITTYIIKVGAVFASIFLKFFQIFFFFERLQAKSPLILSFFSLPDSILVK